MCSDGLHIKIERAGLVDLDRNLIVNVLSYVEIRPTLEIIK
jgi:hypothetical protein